MDSHGRGHPERRWHAAAGLLCALGLWALLCGPASAKDYVNRFTGREPTWIVRRDRSVRLVRHMRHAQKGGSYEYVRLNVPRRRTTITFEHRLPPAEVIDDLKVSLRFNCTQPGATIALRLVFPETIDPRTRRPLTALLPGDRDTTRSKWRTLTVGISRKRIQSIIRRLREELKDPKISDEGMTVAGVVVTLTAAPGDLHAGFAELRYGPIVEPIDSKSKKSESKPRVRPIAHTATTRHPVEFRLDRLRVDGYPFFPRMVAWHRERPADLAEAGYNVVWIPRYNDAKLIRDLRDAGLWMMSSPPARPGEGPDGAARVKRTFGRWTAPILFWNVGTRIPTSARKRLIEWTGRIRQADRVYDRPILGDVAGDERIYSRHIGMLGLSRHVLHTGFSLKQYRNWLIQKQRLSRPGTFVWTWIQTEPRADDDGAISSKNPLAVEPEQIRLQLYAALAAGCRGIGYWKTTSLNDKRPGFEERRLMVAQLNLELDLLTPWLSTGTVVAQTPFGIQESDTEAYGQRRIDLAPRSEFERKALLNARRDQMRRKQQRRQELEATVIRSEYGTLLLPIWYGSDAQYAPGKLVANDAKIVVHGISESASAWEVSTTGVRSLVSKRVTGGTEVTIPRFDQTAAVILTADRRTIEQLRKRVSKTAAASAGLYVRMAKAKLARTRDVNEQLAKLGARQPDAPQLLHKAGLYATAAKSALDRGSYATARLESENCMQLLRILQNAHWSDAARSFASPVSTRYAVSFQSLPEHLRLLTRLQRGKKGGRGNLLRSGDFEDFDTMVVEGWKHTQNSHPSLRAVAELYPKGKEGRYSLRLVAAPIPGKDVPKYLPQPPVTVRSPELTVRSGQIVKITGWVKTATPIVGHPDGAELIDSLGGSSLALRWQAKSDWQKFTLLREAKHSGPMHITLALNGMGEIRFDELQVTVYTPGEFEKPPPTNSATPSRGGLNFLDRLPKLPSLPRPKLPSWGRR